MLVSKPRTRGIHELRIWTFSLHLFRWGHFLCSPAAFQCNKEQVQLFDALIKNEDFLCQLFPSDHQA